MPRNKIRAELVDKSEIPTRKSQYDWNSYFTQLLANPTKTMRFTGVARSTVNEAVNRHNANDENAVKFEVHGKRVKDAKGKMKETIYVSVVSDEPDEPAENPTPQEA